MPRCYIRRADVDRINILKEPTETISDVVAQLLDYYMEHEAGAKQDG